MKTIKITSIIYTVLSFIFGMVAVLIINNFLSAEKMTFSTLDLIGFVLSIIFAGSSLVLAITAINLSRASEKALLDQGENSRTLQNEVYLKTTEALKKIESSTGVTERRIEDMISGRAGAIATKLIDEKVVPEKRREELEKEIKESLRKTETEEEINRRIEREKEKERVMKIAKDYQDELLLKITNYNGVTTLKFGMGTTYGSGINLVDGYYEYAQIKFGVCVFYNHSIITRTLSFGSSEFIFNIANEINNNTFNKIFIVFNENCESVNHLNTELLKYKNIFKEDIFSNISIIYGNQEEVISKMIESLK